jgi:hypothetical protein
MATLNFIQEGEWYVAETTVNNDYSLHVEREKEGFFYMEQKAAGTQFASCEIPMAVMNGFWTCQDRVFAHGYYPLTVRFKSKTPVTLAELNEISNE